MRLELLHSEGCPLAPAAHRLVRQCLTALGIPDPVLVRVGDWPDASTCRKPTARLPKWGSSVEPEPGGSV
jgi:hypothetical protein